MLGFPNAGWSNFDFDENARISYIDDFPYVILEEIIDSIENNHTFCVTLDAEGYDYSILSYDFYDVEYILRKDNLSIKKLDINFKQFIENLIEDIEKDFDKWVIFPASLDINECADEKEIEKASKKLRTLLDKTKNLSKNLYGKEVEDNLER